MWFTLLAPLVSGLFGQNSPITAYFLSKQAREMAAAELARQVEIDKFELSKEYASSELSATKAKLNATSRGFKAWSFVILNIPVFITCLTRDHGGALWDALSHVPVWYAQLYVSVVFVIWGLPVVNNATSTIFSAIQDAFDLRTQRKISVINAKGEANTLDIQQMKDAMFETFKSVMHVNGYTQNQVEQIDKGIDSKLGGK